MRPQLKLHPTKLDKGLEATAFGLLTVLWILILVIFPSLPEQIPVHFSLSGKVDNYGGKNTIMILGIVPSIILLLLTILNRYPHIFNYSVEVTEENAFNLYSSATRLVRFLKVCIVLIFMIVFLSTVEVIKFGQSELAKWVLPSLIIAMFLGTMLYVIGIMRKQH